MRSTDDFKLEKVKTVHYGTECLSLLGPKVWELAPLEIKSSHPLEEFKKKIKSWTPENCPWRLFNIIIIVIKDNVGWKHCNFYYFHTIDFLICIFFVPFLHQRL